MPIEYTTWPDTLATTYRNKGYWLDKPLTSLLAEQAQQTPDAIAIIDKQQQLTYQQLALYSDQLAAELWQRGLQPGDTALIQLPNSAEFYISFFALLKLAVVPVCALFSHRQTELYSYCETVQPALLILSALHPLFNEASFYQQLQRKYPVIRHILLDKPSAESSLKWAYQQPHPPHFVELDATAVAFFQLSGGSTGTPKLIPRTHNDYLYSVLASRDICQLTADCRYLCALPAPHNFALSSPGALGVFAAGGTVVMATDPSPTTCFALIAQHQITHTALVPPALQLWLQHAPQSPYQLGSLQWLQVGGAKLNAAIASQVQPVLGCRLQQVFGMAEGLVNYTRHDDSDWLQQHTQGRPISPDDEIKIVDEAGHPVAAGAVGQLLTRGPYTFRGYYKSDKYNRQVFDAEGFYASGDLVRQLQSGHIIVEGRVKDQINRGGEKIAAAEIENQLLQHSAISQVALVALADTVLGEKSCAFVQLRAGTTVSALELRKYLRQIGMADFKIPDKFQFVTELPLTAVGKVDKKSLRASLELTESSAPHSQ
jgi:2,3-dihydroxybenzoate-AMP ligase